MRLINNSTVNQLAHFAMPAIDVCVENVCLCVCNIHILVYEYLLGAPRHERVYANTSLYAGECKCVETLR